MDDGLVKSPVTIISRRNSISAPVKTPLKLTLFTQKPLETAANSSPLDLELISLKASFASYTSLRDILPSPTVAVNSPTTAVSAANSGYEISIRNRLVKQAAWAYLQPMSASPDSTGSRFFRRFSSSSCIQGLTRLVYRVFRWIRTIFTI